MVSGALPTVYHPRISATVYTQWLCVLGGGGGGGRALVHANGGWSGLNADPNTLVYYVRCTVALRTSLINAEDLFEWAVITRDYARVCRNVSAVYH